MYQSIEISCSPLHAIPELAQEVLELEDSTEHVPVAAGGELSLLKLSEPSLDQGGCLVRAITVVNRRQLNVQL